MQQPYEITSKQCKLLRITATSTKLKIAHTSTCRSQHKILKTHEERDGCQ